ncbi:MAG: phage tail protein [Nostoc sp.]|uniref:phage tail protein n=1 Tax=Nostoc sp. TaxID=1180 RepID=UPI002FF9523E
MATGKRSDPVPAFNFYVSLVRTSSSLAKLIGDSTLEKALLSSDLVIAGGFSECSGLEGTLQIEEYSEGGENRFVHKFPTRMTYSNIVFKRGITFSQELWQWHFDYVNGRGKRLDGLVTLLDESQEAVRIWSFQKGLPLKWTGPTLNAAQNQVAIETLEIIHQGWKPLPVSIALREVGKSFTRVGAAIGELF